MIERESQGGRRGVFQWIRRRSERRRAAQAAFRVEVVAAADQVQAWYQGDAYRAWWRAQDEVRKLDRDRVARRLWMAVVDELDSRIVRVSRPGPDTATRMWLNDQKMRRHQGR